MTSWVTLWVVWVGAAKAVNVDPTVARMVEASDAATRNAVLFREMGRAATADERAALGHLRLLMEALDKLQLDDATVDQWLRAYAAADDDARLRLVEHARRGGLGGPAGVENAEAPPPTVTAPTPGLAPGPMVLANPPLPAPATGQLDIAHLRRLSQLPDPGAAAVLSSTVGFGAGHFYAQQPVRGWTFLAVETTGAAALAAGLATSPEGEWSTLATGALVGLVVARLCDVALAPGSAHDTVADAFR